MIERILYGPIEILPPLLADRATLEIDGITVSNNPYTTYVFLDEIHGVNIEEFIRTHNYAGCFSISHDSASMVQLDITQALNKTLKIRPNFHISFLTRCKKEQGMPAFGFKQLHIHKTPNMDTHPVTHTITRDPFSRRPQVNGRNNIDKPILF